MIAIAGGGTGGHLSIAKSIKEALNEMGTRPIFIGSTNGQDMAWFENDEGFSSKYFLQTGGVVNKKGIAKLRALLKISESAIAAKAIFKKEGITKIFSVGGYSAAPGVFASFGARLFIHEQNAAIGLLNKLARPFAKGFFCSFDDRAHYKGYPVSSVFFESARVRHKIKTVIFLGGSQGAIAINDFALSCAKDLVSNGINIIHQCGIKHEDDVKKAYMRLGVEVDVFGFSKDLVSKIATSDFAVARAGAGTIFELAANGLPALFVPYPYAAQNHQYFNAKFLADQNLAAISLQHELNKNDFLRLLDADYRDASERLTFVNEKNAAKKIAEIIDLS